ncbi:O-antigen polymerase [Phocaeicola sartorii]|uniref:O-antigen polymerase n=1 Tax=Phocaeicola sartorii TaxID=671267 RepID=UPI0013634C07|nr:O-antigen polymerase [Phocaeicola sartorii]NBH68284.1 oligosaccharide repeat unit polymerase [Phocaeicola sartorii]
MFLTLLIVSLVILLLLDYFVLFKRDLATPAISFSLGFLVCAIILLNFIVIWGVRIHIETLGLILGGNVLLSFGAFLYRRKRRNSIKTNETECSFYLISVRRLQILFVFQLFLHGLRTYFLFKFYGFSSLSENLVAHTEELKFGTEAMTYPFGVGFLIGIVSNLGYVFAFLIPVYIAKAKNNTSQFLWLVVNYILALFGSLLSSGRSPMLWMLVALGTFYIISLYQYKKKVGVKRILIWVCAAYAFLSGFQQLGYLLGRKESDETVGYVVGVYCGAEIQNLDDYLNGPKYTTDYWGESTFYGFWELLENDWGMVKLRSERSDFLPFNNRGYYPLGNVYTTFQSYHIDFGMTGALIVCFLIGFIMQYIYTRVKNGNDFKTGVISTTTYIYSIIVPSMFMSFFSEAFFGVFINLLNIRFWLGYVVVFFIFYGRMPWSKSVRKS